MQILLTGSTGFLGKIIFNHLNKVHTIFGLSRSNSNYNIDLSKDVPIFTENFDLVIHCSGKAHFSPVYQSDIDIFHNINVIGTYNLLNGLSRIKLPKYFLFISSVSVYGLTEGNLINENSPLIAKDPYGKSKIDSEILIKNWCNEHNIICTILRLPLIVGPNPPGNLGNMISAIKKGYYFNIDNGKAKKSMVLASDVSKYIIEVAQIGGIYNLTDGHNPTFKELSKYIAKKFDKLYLPNMPLFLAQLFSYIGDLFPHSFPLNSIILNKIISDLTFDDSKARTVFNWNPNKILNGNNL
jgi:nucleoside-diphosphate-sugar epimerase